MRSVIHWILYSNLLIAVAAAAYTLNGSMQMDLSQNIDPVLTWFVGSSTLFIYLLIRYAAVSRIQEYTESDRWNFFLKYLHVFKVILIISGILSFVLYLFLPRSTELILLFPGGISLLYGLPIRFGKKKIRLRDIGIIKIFLISFVWAFVSSILPAVYVDVNWRSPEVLWIFLANYIYIFAITLPFDIKDMEIDAMHHVRTIPVLIGKTMTISLSMLLLFVSAMIYDLYYTVWFIRDISLEVPHIISILITGMTILLANNTKRDTIYFGLLDGMIILQFLLVGYSYMAQGIVSP